MLRSSKKNSNVVLKIGSAEQIVCKTGTWIRGLHYNVVATQGDILGSFHVVVPSVCTIRAKMILYSSCRLPIPIGQKVIWIASGWFLIHAKVSVFCKMVIVFLEHWHLNDIWKKYLRVSFNKSRNIECHSRESTLIFSLKLTFFSKTGRRKKREWL